MKPVQLRLSPRAVELIQAAAVVGKVRPWVVVERAILAMHDGPQGRDSTVISNDTLPHEALEIARECAAFLEAQEDRAAALKVLRRAWKQALALTRLELRADP